jgi:Fe-S cluster assembly ATP-binding protein
MGDKYYKSMVIPLPMSSSSILRIENLSVRIKGSEQYNGNRNILENFSLNIDPGEVHVLLGPNGTGKSTLIYTILGYPGFNIESGKIYFKGKDITNLSINERISLGIGVLFQHPPKVPGVKLKRLVNVCGEERRNQIQTGYNTTEEILDEGCIDINDQTKKLAQRLNIPLEFLERDVNVGFSGGEVKRSEILQMMATRPDFMIFDEPDSGVDIENVELMGKIMRELLQRDAPPKKQKKAGLIITHLAYILQFLGKLDRAHVLIDGKIVCSGNPETILDSIIKFGFDECEICASMDEDDGSCKADVITNRMFEHVFGNQDKKEK